MRLIRFVVNWIIMLTIPIWGLPALIFCTVADAFQFGINLKGPETGGKWIWE